MFPVTFAQTAQGNMCQVILTINQVVIKGYHPWQSMTTDENQRESITIDDNQLQSIAIDNN